jgi:hypothetical protein
MLTANVSEESNPSIVRFKLATKNAFPRRKEFYALFGLYGRRALKGQLIKITNFLFWLSNVSPLIKIFSNLISLNDLVATVVHVLTKDSRGCVSWRVTLFILVDR